MDKLPTGFSPADTHSPPMPGSPVNNTIALILHTCVCFCSVDPSNVGRYRHSVQFLGCVCASVCAVGCALCTVVHRLIV